LSIKDPQPRQNRLAPITDLAIGTPRATVHGLEGWQSQSNQFAGGSLTPAELWRAKFLDKQVRVVGYRGGRLGVLLGTARWASDPGN
jgi:hypothetical protein